MPHAEHHSGDRTILVGLIGRGISLSRTPAMHVAEARAQGMVCTYNLLDMDDAAMADVTLPDLLTRLEAEGYAGVNVTYPFKREVMALLDELSPAARAVDAVNTVVFRDGRRFGHNTDMWGFGESFRRGLDGAKTDHALMIGAGGAGGAVAHALLECGVARLSISDVDPDRAADLAKQLLQTTERDVEVNIVRDIPEMVAKDRPDGVVNATPMGMAKLPGTAFPVGLLTPEMWVADIVYFPLETELLRGARAAGCRVLPGEGMAVFQAVRAFEFFTGSPADPERMKATFRAFDSEPVATDARLSERKREEI